MSTSPEAFDLARQCGMTPVGQGWPASEQGYVMSNAQLTDFASRIRAAALEEAAKACEEERVPMIEENERDRIFNIAVKLCAKAIRALATGGGKAT